MQKTTANGNAYGTIMKLRAVFCCICGLLSWSGPTNSGHDKRHDGSTVSRMLARDEEGGVPVQGHCTEGGTCEETEEELCWGYERGCPTERRLFVPRCEEPPKPWAQTMEAKHEKFWYQGDFGYVKEVVDSIKTLCKPKAKGDSKLECSAHVRFCKARHLYIDFRRFKEITKMEGRYHSFLENIFREGEIGGHCQLDADLLRENGDHKSPLQSWYAELEQFTSLNFKPTKKKHCDEIVTKPTVFIKLDAGVNLYHHFCDFFNLYASQHIFGSFSNDIYIVMWDTSYRSYPELFGDTWKAFSKYPLKRLSDFEGRRICFKDAVFPLLARMRHGLYYNTYLIPGCHGSGLMQAFSKHLLPRLGVSQEPSPPSRVRITLLSRSTRHRRISNEDQLVSAMKTVGYFDVKVVDYKARVFPFLDQIQTSHNSDIFMGIHGSGLTHMLFLPDWAGVFEIYNTEDPRCYKDLARLRGLQYITWENDSKMWKEAEGLHPTQGTPHAKFTNYSFDIAEFMKLVTKLGDDVVERKTAALTHKILGNN